MEEADGMNDQLASIRIKIFVDRIFFIAMLFTPDLPKCLTSNIMCNIVSITCM